MSRRNRSRSSAVSSYTRESLIRVPYSLKKYIERKTFNAKPPRQIQNRTRFHRVSLRVLREPVVPVRVKIRDVYRPKIKPSKFHVKNGVLSVASKNNVKKNALRLQFNRRRYREIKHGRNDRKRHGQVDSIRRDSRGLLSANRYNVNQFIDAAIVARSMFGD